MLNKMDSGNGILQRALRRMISAYSVAKALFILSVAGAIFAFGVAVGEYKIFPYEVARNAANAGSDLQRNWKSYAHIEPTKYVFPARVEGAGVTTHDPVRTQPGLTFMTGLFNRKVSLQLVSLDGQVVHRWIPDYDAIWSTVDVDLVGVDLPFNEWDTLIQGAHPLPDGSVIFNYANILLVKLDKCGKTVWLRVIQSHHSIFVSEDGTIWVSGQRYIPKGGEAPPRINPPYLRETAVQVSPDGEVLREISLPRLLIENGVEGLLFATGINSVTNPDNDFTHLNDVEVLQTKDAAQFPMFEPGDVLISMRNINLLFVFDPDTLKIKWHQTGPWLRQHDPDFLPDGTIAVFNNRRDHSRTGNVLGGSDIMVVDPANGHTSVVYHGNEERQFYTSEMGMLQYLPNGNYLVTETKGGRAFEFNEEGQIVWEYVNRFDDTRIAQMEQATRFSNDYFLVEDWSCE